MAFGALFIGVVIIIQGIVGLAAPEAFATLVRRIQEPPILYLAAVVRVAFGVVLIAAATASRAPMGLRALGILMAIGGLITPFYGVEFARVVRKRDGDAGGRGDSIVVQVGAARVVVGAHADRTALATVLDAVLAAAPGGRA